jgi:polyhydroxybutyrate depolymerase
MATTPVLRPPAPVRLSRVDRQTGRPAKSARLVRTLVTILTAAGALTAAAPTGRATAAAGVPARPSPGCIDGLGSLDQQGMPFSADGDDGAYTEEVPPVASEKRPQPVIVDLHAYEEPGQLQVTLSGLGNYGKTQGFVTVTPWIVNRPVPLWQSFAGSRDMAWFGDLLTHVEATSCVDENRVFVTGYSNGAFMASRIACQYSSRVAAVAPVAGIQATSPCRTKRPVPVVAFHGTADPLVHYDGTPSKTAARLPSPDGTGIITSQEAKVFGTRGIFAKGPTIPEEAASWAKRNGCSTAVVTTRIAPDISLLAWGCPHRADVELYRIRGGGHTWPGSHDSAALNSLLGRTTFSISADAAMWRFFRAHPL